MRKVPINEATDAELRSFALDTLGMSIPANAKESTVLAKVQTAWGKPDILLPSSGEGDDADVVGTAPVPVTPEQAGPTPDKVRIIISVTDTPGGDEPVPVGVNGKVMLIERGKPQDVPRPYFEVLSNAIQHKYDPLPGGGINPVPRQVPLYPFQQVA